MAELVTMPKLGFDMAEGKLVRWVKAEGDTVAKGDVIAEIETDKATVEVESTGRRDVPPPGPRRSRNCRSILRLPWLVQLGKNLLRMRLIR